MRAITWRPVLVILAVALALRIGVVAATDYTPAGDAHDYDRIAESIAHGHGYPKTQYGTPGTASAFRAPAYPYTLAAIYSLAGDRHRWTAARVFGALLGTATVLLIMALGWLVRDRSTGYVAGAIAAIYPPLINIGNTLLTEALFIPLMLATLLGALLYRRSGGRLRWALAAGVLCALSALTRSNGTVLVVPLAAAILLAPSLPRRARLLAAAASLVGLVVTMAPWTVCNFNDFHSFVPITTQSGIVFASTYTTTALPGAYDMNYSIPHQLSNRFYHENEAQLDSFGRSYGERWAIDHPGATLKAVATFALRMVGLRRPGWLAAGQNLELHVSGLRDTLASIAFWLLIAVTLLLPLLRRRVAPIGPWWLWLAPLLLAITTVPFAGSPRYRSIFEPYLVLLAASQVVGALRGLRWPVGTTRWRAVQRSPAKPVA